MIKIIKTIIYLIILFLTGCGNLYNDISDDLKSESIESIRGVLDESFGQNGIVAGTPITVSAMAIQSDEKIVVAGSDGTNFALARYNSNGILDTSFGTNGVVQTQFSPGDYITKIAIQSNNRIIAAGKNNIARYK